MILSFLCILGIVEPDEKNACFGTAPKGNIDFDAGKDDFSKQCT